MVPQQCTMLRATYKNERGKLRIPQSCVTCYSVGVTCEFVGVWWRENVGLPLNVQAPSVLEAGHVGR